MRFLNVMVIVSCLLVGGVVRSGHAGAFNNFFGLNSPGQTLTFDEVVLPMDTVVTNQYAAFGVTFFTPGVYYSPQTGFPSIVGNDVGNYTSSGSNLVDPTTSIHFAQPLTDAAFAMAADITDYTFTALLSGSPVDSATFTVGFANPSLAFIGFQGGPAFDEIQITRVNAGGGPFWLMDNLQTGSAGPSGVPEPSTWLLLATGGLGLLGYRWRRQRAA